MRALESAMKDSYEIQDMFTLLCDQYHRTAEDSAQLPEDMKGYKTKTQEKTHDHSYRRRGKRR